MKSWKNFTQNIIKNFQSGSKKKLDGIIFINFDDLKALYAQFVIRTIESSGKQAHDFLTHVHLVEFLVKRWINGNHQGNIDSYHLPFYFDELAFRFNRRLSTYRGKLFFRLSQQDLATSLKPYKEIVKKKPIDVFKSLGLLINALNVEGKEIWALKK